MNTPRTPDSDDHIGCPIPDCDEQTQTHDHLVDHLTDDHDAFSWISDGRPLPDV